MKRYLAIPGALLLTAAFVRATVNIRWDATSIWMAAAGLAIVACTAVWNRREVIEWVRDPRGVFAVTTGISIAAFVAVIALMNIAVWYAPWSIDLTASGRNHVSPETARVLNGLPRRVSLRQFGRAPDPRIEQLLRGFERESSKVGVEFVDVERQRDLASRYGVIKLGTVVAVAGEKFRKVEDPNEQALVTAVLQVTSDRERVVCFVTGHGEHGIGDSGPTGFSHLAETLTAANYLPQRISLLEGSVPSRCGAVIVAGPREEYRPEEIDRLTAYADHGGRVALMLDPDPAPSFTAWLRRRGIEPGRGAIVDTSGAGRTVGTGPRTPLAVSYGDHPITRGFEVATLYDGARPLHLVAHPELGGQPTALAQTGSGSFASPAADVVPAFQEGRDEAGPLPLAAATSIGSGIGPEPQIRIAAFGDSDFVSNALLRRQGNRDFFLRALAWLLGEQEATIVEVDERENRRVELTESMRAWMYLVNLGFLPLIPLTAGIIMFVRSRR